jgi:ribonuclease HII
MAWIVGIDEAGYGPNLGPLVMTAVGCQIPDSMRERDLWRHLRQAARRHNEADDGRIIVDDSKLVFSTTRGLAELERGTTATLPLQPKTLHDLVGLVCPRAALELPGECWYTGTSALPFAALPQTCKTAAACFRQVCNNQGLHFGVLHGVIVSPTAFNSTVDRWGSKGAVLALAMAELLRRTCRGGDTAGQAISFFIDKHGGRNHYAAALQTAFDHGVVLARTEGALQSVYEVIDHNQSVAVTIEPRAEESHFCVALASMVSKYLRELLMLEFNRFWQQRIPGLRPTAGYPGDAKRYWNEIAGVVKKMGIRGEALWRSR